jgi:hypothetical protein
MKACPERSGGASKHAPVWTKVNAGHRYRGVLQSAAKTGKAWVSFTCCICAAAPSKTDGGVSQLVSTVDIRPQCIIILSDTELESMCQAYENKQRKALDVINKKYGEFIRACPS